MKKFLLCSVLIFVILHCSSQNWQTVISNRQAFFRFNDSIYTNYHRAIRIDSVAVAGSDSLFFTYKVVDDNPIRPITGCYLVNDTGWAGYKVIIKLNGDNLFITTKGDSVVLKTLANLNDTWRLNELGNNEYIQGTISLNTTETILGVMDSIKYIKLQAYNGTTQISHPINNLYFKISKDYGLVQSFRIADFPLQTTIYTIDGISNPLLGIQNLTADEVYNFNVGDTFQYIYDDRWEVYSFDLEYSQDVILSKNVSLTGDTLDYFTDRMVHHRRFDGLSHIDTTYFIHDTITNQIILSSNYFFSTFCKDIDKFPHELYTNSTGFSEELQDTSLNGRRYKIFPTYLEYDSPDSSCIGDFYIGRCIFDDFAFADGIGMVYDIDHSEWGYCRNHQLVYYRKGGETWGAPLDWPKILGIGELSKSYLGITISPNPLTSFSTLQLNTQLTSAEVVIYNMLGKEMLRKTLTGNSMEIEKGTLGSGVYFVRVRNEERQWVEKMIVE